MEFGVIKEIGTAFLVGSVIFFAFEGLLYFSVGWALTGFFRRPLGIETSEMRGGAFVALVIVIGMTMVAISRRPVDESAGPVRAIAAPLFSLLQDHELQDVWGFPGSFTVGDLRRRVLLKGDGSSELSGLGKEIAHHKLASKYCELANTQVREEELLHADEDNRCPLTLFYTAKNWAFRQQTLFDELIGYQTRIHFFGAISLACVMVLPLVFTFWSLAACRAWEITGKVIAVIAGIGLSATAFYLLFMPWKAFGGTTALVAVAAGVVSMLVTCGIYHLIRERLVGSPSPSPKSVASSLFLFGLLIVGIHLATSWAYVRETDEFSRRVYGYFSSAHVVAQDIKLVK